MWLDFLRDYEKAIFPILTFLLGFASSRFTMTMSERKQYEQKLFENGKQLLEAQNARFQELSSALQKYASRSGEPTLDDFFEVSTVGEKYFYQLEICSDAILLGKVDSETRDKTLVPRIRDAVKKTLPTFYEVLQSIASKRGIEYHGKLRREDYEGLFTVVEKYA